ncbi:sensor histidine kinase [Arthrobacter livingstonensis]|uniref:Sensor-like histidine kinase SenX3 n=1 Tax=Arthrobacter livingstonensis TaxID=670078 RepID=A0A2V5LUW4_9MICC|nr:HAMP domain-containing sensor histidine kinase [Arthrobacter livingstonensis]PYI67217.1 sensor histidine kinase [Arthrobacter livingstonensis]
MKTGRDNTGGTTLDAVQLRRAALTVGLRIAVACAVMVLAVIVAAAIYMLYLSHHPDLSAQDPGSARVYVESNDMLKAMAVAGLAGILAAGAIGWLSARSAIRPLGRALELQRRFVQDASHELRTPLAILDARVQLAQHKVADGTEASSLLAQVRRDTAGLTATVQELLLAATGDPDSPAAEAVDVSAVTQAVTDDLQDMAAARGVRLEFVHSGSPRVRIQPNSLRRAVLGLVDNALTHTPEGGLITVTAAADGRESVVSVADTGTGISGIDQDRVFERFARTTEPSPGGRRSYGLGLALVREIAAAAGGRVEISSTGPRGTTMELAFPAAG